MNSQEKINEIKKKTIKGTLQLITREIGMKGIAIIGQLFLVKLLSPSSFGVFAILSFLLSTAETFTDIGLGLTIIQKKRKPTIKQLSTIFYIKLALTLSVILVLNIFAHVTSSIYYQFGTSEILMFRLLSLTLLIKPLQTIISSVLERNLRYRDIALIDTSGMISYYAVAIILALIGFDIWSFIWAVVAMTITETAVTFYFNPWLPKFSLDIGSVRSFLNIGKYFQLGFFLTIFRSSVIPVIGGTRLPLHDIGLLDWSFNMSSVPRVFIDNLGRVSFSSFSRMQESKKNIAESLEQAFSIISITATFVIPITIIFGHDLIIFFLNDKWLPALPALYWYVGSIFFLNGVGLFGHALLAIGKIKQMLFFGTTVTLIELLVSFILLINFGFVGVAIGFFISNFLLFATYVWLCNKEKIFIKVSQTIIHNLIIFALTFLYAFSINEIFPPTFLSFVLKLVATGIGYIIFVIVISPDTFKMSLKFVKKLRE